jgi:hypothetical protein
VRRGEEILDDRHIRRVGVSGHGLNNVRENLRMATRAQNQQNQKRRKNNTSGIKGVKWDNRYKHWHVCIQKDGRHHSFRYYKTLEEAKIARDALYQRLHGEFHRLE